jgi:hypothetical protein
MTAEKNCTACEWLNTVRCADCHDGDLFESCHYTSGRHWDDGLQAWVLDEVKT